MSVAECCGREVETVGVACVPGAPVSIAWCKECLQHGAQPMFVVETGVCEIVDDPDGPGGMRMLSVQETIDKRGDPRPHLADWFLQSEVYVDGAYVTIDDWLGRLVAG